MITEQDYNAAIAKAAREYRAARHSNALERTEETQVDSARAYDTLCWMLDAQTYGWDPSKYVPEWEDVPDGDGDTEG